MKESSPLLAFSELSDFITVFWFMLTRFWIWSKWDIFIVLVAQGIHGRWFMAGDSWTSWDYFWGYLDRLRVSEIWWNLKWGIQRNSAQFRYHHILVRLYVRLLRKNLVLKKARLWLITKLDYHRDINLIGQPLMHIHLFLVEWNCWVIADFQKFTAGDWMEHFRDERFLHFKI